MQIVGDDLFLAGIYRDSIDGAVFDADGNLYLTGSVSEQANFGDGFVAYQNGYIASFDAGGALRWKYLWGNFGGFTASNHGLAIAVSDDKVCATGSFSGLVSFGGADHQAAGLSDGVVVCLNPATGGYLWDRAFGGSSTDWGGGIAIGVSGDVFVSGAFQNNVDFGGGTIVGAGYSDMFVARWAGDDGGYEWATTIGCTALDSADEIALDDSENVYVSAVQGDTCDFGGGPRTPWDIGGSGVLLALDSTGDYRWDVTHPSLGAVSFRGLGVQSTGNVVAGGNFRGTLNLGGPVVAAETGDSLEALVVSFDDDGNFLWQYTPQGPGGSTVDALAIGTGDEIVATGEFRAGVAFGVTPHTMTAGEADIFVLGLTSSGAYWSDATIGGPSIDGGGSVAIGADSAIAVGAVVGGPIAGHGYNAQGDAILLRVEQ